MFNILGKKENISLEKSYEKINKCYDDVSKHILYATNKKFNINDIMKEYRSKDKNMTIIKLSEDISDHKSSQPNFISFELNITNKEKFGMKGINIAHTCSYNNLSSINCNENSCYETKY